MFMGLYLIIFFFDDLLMFFLYFICKPLPNMRKQHIKIVPSEVFCLWLLAWKQQLVHPFLISVIVIFSRVLGSIHGVSCRWKLVQLPLMNLIFSATKGLYNIILLYSSAPQTSLASVQGFSLMITTHNSTALKENGMAEDIFIKFWAPARSLGIFYPVYCPLQPVWI